ncbi:PglL family O-oligosaccharyltransferase [Undibacterium curvum]|uniref:O-antigen ligase C-terminal domain-containing protein n=1 Tax=Undibacterium curvum TaxID=2762294 RepID=A0ABR7A3I8_9BURK|nr:O-antigen ligase family protein [Undibacterium curvum]MBC3931212.1 O-antigen ligase C-terminal domain-containing protein [Undibacterium curvum]
MKPQLVFAALPFALGMVIAFLTPVHLHPLRSYFNDLAIILGLIVSVWMAAGNAGFRWRVNAIAAGFAAMLLLIWLQYGLANHQAWYDLLLPSVYFVLAAFAVMLGAGCGDYTEQSDRLGLILAIAFLLTGLLSVLIQVVQSMGWYLGPLLMYMGKSGVFQRPYANLAQPNQLALVLSFSLAACWFLYREARLGRGLALMFSLILLTGLVITQSRIGWIIVPAFALVLALRDAAGRRLHPAVVVGLLAAYLAAVLLLPKLVAAAGLSGASVIDHVVGSRSERLGLWKQALQLAQTHPWTGVGWFGFGAGQVQIAADLPSTTYAEHAHNLLLNFAAEMGFPVTIIMAAGLLCWCWLTCIRTTQSPFVRFAGLCLIAAAVHSMVEFPLWYAYILLPLAFIMGMLHQRRWPVSGYAVPAVFPRMLVLCALMAAALLTWDYLRVVRAFKVLRVDPVANQQQSQLKQPAYTVFPQFYAYFHLFEIQPHAGMSDAEIEELRFWVERFGFVHNLNKLAEVYVLNQRPDEGVRAMHTLQRLHPEVYVEYFDYWQAKARQEPAFRAIIDRIPARDAP